MTCTECHGVILTGPVVADLAGPWPIWGHLACWQRARAELDRQAARHAYDDGYQAGLQAEAPPPDSAHRCPIAVAALCDRCQERRGWDDGRAARELYELPEPTWVEEERP